MSACIGRTLAPAEGEEGPPNPPRTTATAASLPSTGGAGLDSSEMRVLLQNLLHCRVQLPVARGVHREGPPHRLHNITELLVRPPQIDALIIHTGQFIISQIRLPLLPRDRITTTSSSIDVGSSIYILLIWLFIATSMVIIIIIIYYLNHYGILLRVEIWVWGCQN